MDQDLAQALRAVKHLTKVTGKKLTDKVRGGRLKGAYLTIDQMINQYIAHILCLLLFGAVHMAMCGAADEPKDSVRDQQGYRLSKDPQPT